MSLGAPRISETKETSARTPETKQVTLKLFAENYDSHAHDGPLDLDKLIGMVLESKEAAQVLEGKEAVLLLGPTGVGKTTTINWIVNGKKLLPSTEEMEMKDGTVEVLSVWLPDKKLPGFEVSGSAVNSATSTFRAIFDAQLGLHLCDAPGMFDTNGPAVDIANAVGIANVLRSCKSVRFLVLIDSKAMCSTRGKSIKDLMQVLIRFMGKDMSDFDSFTFLYTRGAPIGDITSLLKQLWSNVKKDSPLAQLSQTMLNSLNKHQANVMVNQSMHGPEYTRTLLQNSKAFSTQGFHSPLTTEDIHVLKLACQSKQVVIEEYLRPRSNKEINYQDVSSQLIVLGKLMQEVPEPEIKEILDDVNKLTLTHLTHVLDQAKCCLTEVRFGRLSIELEALRQAAYFLEPHKFTGFNKLFQSVETFREEINAKACETADTAAKPTTSLGAVCAALDTLRQMRENISPVFVPTTVKKMDAAVRAVGDRLLAVQSRVYHAVESLSQPKLRSPSIMSASENDDSDLKQICDSLTCDLIVLKDAKILSSHLLEQIPNLNVLYEKESGSIRSMLSMHTTKTNDMITFLRKPTTSSSLRDGAISSTAASTLANASHSTSHAARRTPGPPPCSTESKASSTTTSKRIPPPPPEPEETIPKTQLPNAAELSGRLQVLKVVCEHRGLKAHLDLDAHDSFDVALKYVEILGEELLTAMDNFSSKTQFDLLVEPVGLCLWLCNLSSDIYTLLHDKTMHKLRMVLVVVTELCKDSIDRLERSKQAGESTYELFLGLGKAARSVSLAVPLDKFLPQSMPTERAATQIRAMYEELVQQLSNRFKVVMNSCNEALSKTCDSKALQQALGELDKFHHVHDLVQEEDLKDLVSILTTVQTRVTDLKTRAELLNKGPGRATTNKRPDLVEPNSGEQKQSSSKPKTVNSQAWWKKKAHKKNQDLANLNNDPEPEEKQEQRQAEVTIDTFKVYIQDRAVLRAATETLLQMKFGEVVDGWYRYLDTTGQLSCIDSELSRFMKSQAQERREQFSQVSQELDFRSMISVLDWFASAALCCGKDLGQEVVVLLDEADLRKSCSDQLQSLSQRCRSAIDQNDYDAALRFLENIDSASVLQEYTPGFDISAEHRDMRVYLAGKKGTVVASITKDLTKKRFESVAKVLAKMKASSSDKEFEDCDDVVYDYLEETFLQVQGFAFDISNFSWSSLQQLSAQITTFKKAECLQGVTTYDVKEALEKAEDILKAFFLKFNKSCIGNLRRRRYSHASTQWTIIQQFQDPRLIISKDISDLIAKKTAILVSEINSIEKNLRKDYAVALCVNRVPASPKTKSTDSKDDGKPLRPGPPMLVRQSSSDDLALSLVSGKAHPEEAEAILYACKEATKVDAFLDSSGVGAESLSIDFPSIYNRLQRDTKTYLGMIGQRVRQCLFNKELAEASKGIRTLRLLASISERHKYFVREFVGIESLMADYQASKNSLSSSLAPSLTAELAPSVCRELAETFQSDGQVAAEAKINVIVSIFFTNAKEFEVDLSNCTRRNFENMSDILALWKAYEEECLQYNHLKPLKNYIHKEFLLKQSGLLWEKVESHMNELEGAAINPSRFASILAPLRLVFSTFKEASFRAGCFKRLGEFILKAEAAMSTGQKHLSIARLYLEKLDLTKELDLKALNTHAQVVYRQNQDESEFDVTAVLVQQAHTAVEAALKALQSQKYDTVRHCMHNLGQLRKHKIAASDLNDVCQECESQLTEAVVLCINDFQQRAIVAVDTNKISELEPIWREIDAMEAVLSQVFKSAFGSSLSNQLSDNIYARIKTIIKEFDHRDPSIEDVGELLLRLQHYVREISKDSVKQLIRDDMQSMLQKYKNNQKWNFFALGQYLKQQGAIGLEVVRSVPIFEANRLQHFQAASSRVTVDDALLAMQSPKWANINGNLNVSELKHLYGIFETRFTKLTKQHLFENRDEELVKQVKKEAAKLSNQSASQWSNIRSELASLLAGVFATWSVTKSANLYEQKPVGTPVFYEPHPIQVITVFRLLGLDEKASKVSIAGTYLGVMSQRIQNHLCQVITGGGKSVVLGTLATLLALLGFDVKCACYSKYLSQRDEKDFAALWTSFGVKNKIKYSTLDVLVEDAINRTGNIRRMTDAIINKHNVSSSSEMKSSPCVLLIDEVDVFLTDTFFGNSFHPVTTFQSKSLTAIVDYVWKNYTQQNISIETLQNLPEYNKLKRELSAISGFEDQLLKTMLDDVNKFQSPKYLLSNEAGTVLIGYLAAGGHISTSTNYGFRTVFAYLHERDNPSSGATGPVTAETAAENIKVNIRCGAFSYARIPQSSQFSAILGVTGTLDTLGTYEKQVLKRVYKIQNQTITPSIYGNSRLDFKQNGPDVHVSLTREGDSGWTQKLTGAILQRVKDEARSVLVFFQSEDQLDMYVNSSQGKQLMQYSPKPEIVKSGDPRIAHHVETAPLKGRITLFDRVWGRGLDFICDDSDVKKAGGVHVIQTFFSEDFSEEVQIKGRTARSMDRGSYQLVLCAEDLREFGITDQELETLSKGVGMYDKLCGLRTVKKDKQTTKRTQAVQQAEAAHDVAMEYVDALRQQPIEMSRVQRLLKALQ